jgi:hypothetical protein
MSDTTAKLVATVTEHLDAAVDAQVAEVGINRLRCANDVIRQVVALGATPDQVSYLMNEVAEVRLVFECRGWA